MKGNEKGRRKKGRKKEKERKDRRREESDLVTMGSVLVVPLHWLVTLDMVFNISEA